MEEQSPFADEEPSAPQEQQPAEESAEPPEPAEQPVPEAEPAAEGEFPEPAEQPVPEAEPAAEGEFQDKVIQCAQCGAEFVHAASAQAFYKEKGFANEPKRCPACRRARKTQSGGAARGGAPRQMYPAVCAECGKATQVPFKPSGARPVYCLDCYRKQRGG